MRLNNRKENKELPDGWIWASVKDLFDVVGGGTPSTKVSEYWNGEIPWITSADIHGLKEILPRKKITKEAIEDSSTNLIPENSIIVVTRVSLGKVALASFPLCFSQDSQGLIGNPELVQPEYALYYLSDAVQEFKYTGRGTTISGVTKKQLKDLPFVLPPLNEQGRIVNKIEELCSQLDFGIAELERVQANLARYKASVLKAACEGRLVPTEAELARAEGREYESGEELLQRILAERKKKWEEEQRAKGKDPSKMKYQEPERPDAEGLPELPEGWVWATVDQLTSNEPNSFTDGPFGSKLKTSHYTDSGPRVIRLQNVGEGEFIDEEAHISQGHFETLKKHEVFEGDLVIGALGSSLPRSCIIPSFVGPAIVKADCMRFKPHPEIADVKYLNAVLNSEVLKKFAARIVHGIGRPRLNQTEVKSLPIPLPPLGEQNRIAKELESRLSVVKALETEIEHVLIRAERLRQAILKRAFEGKLVPQDAEDEPASKLLDQIGTQRNLDQGSRW